MFNNKKTSDDFILKSLFLYFFEFMGISDKDTLKSYCSHVIKRMTEKDLLKPFNDKLEISLDKLPFFNQDKLAIAHKKYLKKGLKIFFGNIIDAFPEKEQFL